MYNNTSYYIKTYLNYFLNMSLKQEICIVNGEQVGNLHRCLLRSIKGRCNASCVNTTAKYFSTCVNQKELWPYRTAINFKLRKRIESILQIYRVVYFFMSHTKTMLFSYIIYSGNFRLKVYMKKLLRIKFCVKRVNLP